MVGNNPHADQLEFYLIKCDLGAVTHLYRTLPQGLLICLPKEKTFISSLHPIFIMNYRFLASALVASLLACAAATVALSSAAYAQQDDLWYPGEGIKQDTYFTYRIQEFDTNDEQPYEMTLYFQEQDQDGDWMVPAFVVDDDGSVISGTMKLSDSMASLAGGDDVPQNMIDYISGYSGSLHWVDSFTTKADPKSLSAPNWGRSGNIGGSDLKPSGKETITVPAGTYETTVLVLHKGQADSKIWVQNGFPFPIKALFFTDTTAGAPQTQFEFELLKTGTGKPETPSGAQEVPTPPLTKTTGRGQYAVSLDWSPAEIKPESTVLFTIGLTDKSGFPLERANYDFVVKNRTGGIIQEFKNQNADVDLGTATHEVEFNGAGGMTATVIINSVRGQPAGGTVGFTESADFNIVVVPEFPTSAAIVAAAVVGLVVLVTRARGASLGSLFGNRGVP